MSHPLHEVQASITGLALDTIVDEVRHLLPTQAPIRRFVHHNTLHHFEHLNFHQAVVEGGQLLGCQPYPSESFFARQTTQGRITEADLKAVLPREDERPFEFSLWTRQDFKIFRLRHLFDPPARSKVRYLLEEGELLSRVDPLVSREAAERLNKVDNLGESLSSLWNSLVRQVPFERVEEAHSPPLLSEIHSFLIRFCAAYLDQGISYWPMPVRDGLYSSFLRLYSQKTGLSSPWQKGLRCQAERQARLKWTAHQALEDGFKRLEIPWESALDALTSRALALRGWAGMIAVLEQRPDLAPVHAPPVSLIDFLALYLQLEAHVLESRLTQQPLRRGKRSDYALAYEAFILAQCAGLEPEVLKQESAARAWVKEVRAFDHLSRRRALLEAFEHRYRHQMLDGLGHHCRKGTAVVPQKPRFQAVFCIDDREESLRRHLEELCPDLETLGYAGFYGVAMVYQGLTDPQGVPLCPPVRTPQHLVREVALDGSNGPAATLGHLRQTLRASRNSLLRGGLLSAFTGFLAGIPLVTQTLLPGLSHRIGSKLEERLSLRPGTRLALERAPDVGPNQDNLYEGFTVQEMASIVDSGLRTMGVNRFALLFCLVGHGSSCLNNPHEAAYNCGATGGGRGGPNARAFAAMANHPRVRELLAAAGWMIPKSTWFLGAYHNTCNDSMTYYDLDLVPQALAEELKNLQELFHQGCLLDAHERCRRFENVPLSITPEKAFQLVQTRAVTLAQPRPEYGHSTNSLCIVGRRERTRGVFLDRRAFLVSYDPTADDDGSILGSLLEAVGPVGTGINLEYYFSAIDSAGYGCGTKLPHNVTGLLGVMDGHASDLRTGLPWQMVEIHEPMRLLHIVECEPSRLYQVLLSRPALKQMLDREWFHLVAWSPESSNFWLYRQGDFLPHCPGNSEFPSSPTSLAYYTGRRGHLAPARILAGVGRA